MGRKVKEAGRQGREDPDAEQGRGLGQSVASSPQSVRRRCTLCPG